MQIFIFFLFFYLDKYLFIFFSQANILVNEDCSIRICDFGLARSLHPLVSDVDDEDEQKLAQPTDQKISRDPTVLTRQLTKYGSVCDHRLYENMIF